MGGQFSKNEPARNELEQTKAKTRPWNHTGKGRRPKPSPTVEEPGKKNADKRVKGSQSTVNGIHNTGLERWVRINEKENRRPNAEIENRGRPENLKNSNYNKPDKIVSVNSKQKRRMR